VQKQVNDPSRVLQIFTNDQST